MKYILHIIFCLCTTSIFSQSAYSIEYYRHLKYNHVSPYIDLIGIHPIDQATAKSTSHYVFKHDKSNRLIEIINNHYHTEKKHPLASIGVYKLVINYIGNTEVRTFFDIKGQRISNDRAVYKEVYTYDENQQKTALQFYDLEDQPMESNWKIGEYKWTQSQDLIIEERYNLTKGLVNVSPYFEFGITGISLNDDGSPNAHYNLDHKFNIVNNSLGVASYRDQFDSMGNHITYSYYNAADSLTLNQWRFAIGQKSYDGFGNHILLEQFDTEHNLIRSRPVPSNAGIQMSVSASNKDSLEIRRLSLGYLSALQKMDTFLMKEVMNDSLNKVTIGYNRSIRKEVARPTTYDQMIAFAEDWNKSNTKFPLEPNDQVTILRIYNRIASVELISDNWVEYLHLIKLDGKWEIINLIWQHKDVNRYPK